MFVTHIFRKLHAVYCGWHACTHIFMHGYTFINMKYFLHLLLPTIAAYIYISTDRQKDRQTEREDRTAYLLFHLAASRGSV
jgi:hypothetical protein